MSLKSIENLSYICSDARTLIEFNKELQSLEFRMRVQIPHQDSLLLRPTLVTVVAKKVRRRYARLRALRSLGKQKHGKRPGRKLQNQIGEKAQRLKKVNQR